MEAPSNRPGREGEGRIRNPREVDLSRDLRNAKGGM
jgi:hypothetical protein